MGNNTKQIHVLLILAVAWLNEAAPSRVVQLVAENPSQFVSADPDDPKYIISLFDDGDTAAGVVPEVPSVRSSIMTNAAGQQFNCSIPSSPPGVETALTQLDPDTTPAYNLIKSPHELLESLEGMCMYRQDGLWTYEVCHRKHVRQFRQVSLQPGSLLTLDATAAGGAELDTLLDAALSGDFNKLLGGAMDLMLESGKKAEDFICGKYTGDDKQNEAVLEDTSSSGHPLKYVSHKFAGGANCVLTGQPRTAEVRYTCVRETSENVVLSVREFPTCNYVVVISTPFLCKHPSFVPPDEDIRLISCVPIEPPPAGPQKQAAHASNAAAVPAAAAVVTSGAPAAAAKQPAAVMKDAVPTSKRAKTDRKGRHVAPSPAYVEDETEDHKQEQSDFGSESEYEFEWSYDDDEHEGQSEGDHTGEDADPSPTDLNEGIALGNQQEAEQQQNQQHKTGGDVQHQHAQSKRVQQQQHKQQQKEQHDTGGDAQQISEQPKAMQQQQQQQVQQQQQDQAQISGKDQGGRSHNRDEL